MDRPVDEHRVTLPLAAALLGVSGLLALVVAMSLGRGGDPVSAVEMLPSIGQWAAPGLAYLAAATGYGVLLRPLVRGASNQPVLCVGLGLAALATISQVAGCVGLLASVAGAIGLLAPGWVALVALLWSHRRHRLGIPRPGALAWLALVPVAILVAAASAPPGWLWDSEYGGFDVLSYHLQLPQEWLARGRIEPYEHNVYSYLPGSFEAAVLHLASMTGAPQGAANDGGVFAGFGLLGGTGWRAIAAQHLHAWMALLAAWMVGCAARAAAVFGGASAGAARASGLIAGVLVLATPWTVVVGSLAYNEMPVVALGAAALVASLDGGMPAWRRGLLAGLLVGAACGFKPTAMTFLTPGLGVVLLATTRPRAWPVMIAAGAGAGALMLMPWMIRNAMAGGNPVFPFGSGIFGSAHWTPEQVARYAAGHAFDGSLLDRLRLLVAENPDAAEGARDVERWRGLLNPQYAAVFPAAAGALVGALIGRPALRRPVALMGVMLLLGLAAWLLTTHLQARFLLPLMLPACVLVGLALGDEPAPTPAGRWRPGVPIAPMVRRAIAVLLIAAQCAALLVTFVGQRGGAPNLITAAGPALFTGAHLPDPGETAAGFMNRALPPGSRTYLIGDAGPFYLSAGPAEVRWHTTWDSSLLGELIREHGDDPVAWTAGFRALGITHVLLNFAELARYQRSGWYDPDVTPDRVSALVQHLGRPLAAWEQTGQAIFVLPGPRGEQPRD